MPDHALTPSPDHAVTPSSPAGDRQPLLLTAEQLGVELGLSLRTVRRLDQRGELPRPVTVGRAIRWRRDELVAWVRAGCPRRDRWSWVAAEH